MDRPGRKLTPAAGRRWDSERGRSGSRSELAALAARSIEDTFINAAEAVQGVLFAQADCDHPRGQGTVDVIVTGTAGEATEGLLDEVRDAVDKIAGPYDNVLVKSSTTVSQDIEVTVSTSDVSEDEDIKNRVYADPCRAARRSERAGGSTSSGAPTSTSQSAATTAPPRTRRSSPPPRTWCSRRTRSSLSAPSL
ncbi:MAG: baseplate J/gp47 family protein [Clostridia bacterium]